MRLPLIALAIFSALQLAETASTPPIVKTKNGLVAGYVKYLDEGQTAFVYEGIPYARPPLGELRFQKTQPVENWTGVYNATRFRNACMQPDQLVPDNNIPETQHKSEDCLFLTIYRPSTESTKPRAVMVWIHGGGFETGSIFSIAYDASYIATIGDVIVVPIQYRLGSFGFLRLSEKEGTPGNAGLYDQITAIEWVRTNIAAFGGDPHQITIFGESAGGMSVGALILSPLANGLFQRAVLQSGSPNSYLGSESVEQALVKTRSLVANVNCTAPTDAEVVKCLRKLPAAALVKATEHARTNGESFEPVWGSNELLPIKPAIALKTGQFNRNIDVMFGTVADEGYLFVESIFPAQLDPDIPKENVTLTVDQAKFLIQLMFQMFKESYGDEVADFYTKDIRNEDKDAIRKSISDAFGDYHITCPTILFGQYYASLTKANVAYAYRMTRPPAIPVFLKCRGKFVCHGDDVLELFGFPIKLRGIVYTEEDYKQSVDMIIEWSTFARTGKPTSPMSNGAKWLEAIDHTKANAQVRYMALNAANYQLVENYYAKTCSGFWKSKLMA